MKKIFRLFFVTMAVSMGLSCFASNKEEITLTVTSDGATKDEAIKNALRTAVEQAYGAFVSANTDIFNDELVRDEIATVSSGNIKKFTVVAYSKNENSHTVTINVIVSKGKLLSYAKNKGAECELDGASLASDIELQILYKKNEEAAIQNLITELLLQLDNCFDYKVVVDKFSYTPQEMRWDYIDSSYDLIEPKTRYSDRFVSIPYKVTATLNKKGVSIFTQFIEKLKSLGLNDCSERDRNEIFEATFFPPFKTVKVNKKYPEYSPLRYSVEIKYPEIIFRSPKSAKSLQDLFGRHYQLNPITQWLYDCSIDIEDSDISDSNIEVIGEGCIFNGNFSTDYRTDPLDAIRNEENAEYFFSFGTINLPIDKVKKIKNLKVVHN